MKKYLYLGMAALLALAACSKEEEGIQLKKKPVETITFVAEKAGLDTKTAVVEGTDKASYIWTDEDEANLSVYAVTTTTTDEGTTKEVETALTIAGVTISDDNKIMTIEVEKPEAAASYTFRAKVAGDRTSGGNPRIPATQKPEADSFDPSADILVSQDLETESLTDLAFTFERKVVVNKMTLKNIVAGEKVSEVKINSDKNLTGYFNGTEMVGQNKQIALSYNNAEIGENGEFEAWFIAMPNEGQTLTVTVTTDAHIYTKAFTKTIDLTRGNVTLFSVALPEPEEIEDFSGEWIIAGTHNGYDLAATAWTSGTFYPAEIVTINTEDQTVLVKGETAPFKMTVSKVETGDYEGLYTIVDANGNYLTAIGNGQNQLAGKSEPEANSYWTIAQNPDGTYDIIAPKNESGRNTMRVNYNEGKPRVSCYLASNNQQPKVVLYPFANIQVDTTPTMTADKTAFTFPAVGGEDVIRLTCTYLTGDVTAVASDEDWIEVTYFGDDEVDFEVYANVGAEREGTITISSEGVEDIVVTIKQLAPLTNDGTTPETAFTASEAYAYVSTLDKGVVSTESFYVKGIISNVKYYFDAEHGTATFDISDDGQTSGNQFTAYSTYYFNNAAWKEGDTQIKVGDEVIVYGQVVNYNGNTPEFSSKKSCLYYLKESEGGEGGETTGNVYSLYSGNLTEGDYLIVYDGAAMNTTVSTNRLQYTAVTITSNQITDPDASIIWHIAPSGNYWTIYNAAAEQYAAGNGTKNQAAMNADGTVDNSLWTVSGTETYEFVNKLNSSKSVNANLRKNGTYGFACYGTQTGGALSLYKLN